MHTFAVEKAVGKDSMLDGQISGELSTDGKIIELNYGLKQCRMYKTFKGISEQEAFEQICAGNFGILTEAKKDFRLNKRV